MRAARESARQRAADGDSPALGWSSSRSINGGGIIPDRHTIEASGNFWPAEGRCVDTAALGQLAPLLYPRAVSLLPYYRRSDPT